LGVLLLGRCGAVPGHADQRFRAMPTTSERSDAGMASLAEVANYDKVTQRRHIETVDPHHRPSAEKAPSMYLETLVHRYEARKREMVSPLQMVQCPPEEDPTGGSSHV
jgi:hypothetical protein